MSKPNALGFFMLICSGFILIFKFVAKLMNQEFNYFHIEDIIGNDWINSIPWASVQNIAEYFTKLTLPVALLVLGAIFIAVGAFKRV